MFFSSQRKCCASFIKTSHALAMLLFLFFISCKKDEQAKPVVPQPPPPARPNIVLFLADDFGYEIPTSDGGQSYQTPNIDKMAADGMRFTQCYSSPICSPSRIMLLTGKYSFRNYRSWGHLELDQKTIANMMNDAGYNTCIAGKWQIQGGNDTINSFGFSNYCIWNISADGENGSRYKNPTIYKNGAYLPEDSVKNKFGDDIFTDYIKEFLKNNAAGSKPFFVYYPLCLVHKPFTPVPGSPDYDSWVWNPGDEGDPKYFPSMVNYMDKKIGEVIAAVNSSSSAGNTIFLFSGDNGTSVDIYSQFNGATIRGGKGKTTESGTHVPLIAYCPGYILPSVNNNLVDFTDFLPTLADAAGIAKPSTYGILDGISFYPQLFNQNSTPRDWIFCHYAPHKDDVPVRYVQNQSNKYYEDDRFYDIITDKLEISPLPDSRLTTDEKNAKVNFESVLSEMHN